MALQAAQKERDQAEAALRSQAQIAATAASAQLAAAKRATEEEKGNVAKLQATLAEAQASLQLECSEALLRDGERAAVLHESAVELVFAYARVGDADRARIVAALLRLVACLHLRGGTQALALWHKAALSTALKVCRYRHRRFLPARDSPH